MSKKAPKPTPLNLPYSVAPASFWGRDNQSSILSGGGPSPQLPQGQTGQSLLSTSNRGNPVSTRATLGGVA